MSQALHQQKRFMAGKACAFFFFFSSLVFSSLKLEVLPWLKLNPLS